MAVYPVLAGIASNLLLFLGFFSPKIRRFTEGRREWRKDLRIKMKTLAVNSQPLKILMFHCSSVGEFEQARPVIERMHAEFPDHRILLTFFSPSGYELRKKYPAADLVCYLPLDTKTNMVQFLDLVQPVVLIIIKYEFWPNLLLECHRRNIPVISVSAIFRPGHFYFKWYGSYFLKAIKTINHFFVQDQQSRDILVNNGINQSTVAGDTRFDRVLAIRDQSAPVAEAVEFSKATPTMIIGSAWPADMEVLTPVIKKLSGRLKFIIVPHEVEDASVEKICKNLPDYIKFSEWKTTSSSNIMVVDKMGMLSRIYASGVIAWIGGAYGKGLHNILEAAVYGLPVFFGNRNYEKFREARELIEAGAAFAISDAADLEKKLCEILDHPERLRKLSQSASDYVRRHLGATEKVIQFLRQMLLK